MFGLTRLVPAARSQLVPRAVHQLKSVRNMSDAAEPWFYREARTTHKRSVVIGTELLMATMYYWMFFHLYYDFGHIVGHFEYPDTSKWTDEELGITSED